MLSATASALTKLGERSCRACSRLSDDGQQGLCKAGTNTNASVQIVNCTYFYAGFESFVLILAYQAWKIALATSKADRLDNEGSRRWKAGMSDSAFQGKQAARDNSLALLQCSHVGCSLEHLSLDLLHALHATGADGAAAPSPATVDVGSGIIVWADAQSPGHEKNVMPARELGCERSEVLFHCSKDRKGAQARASEKRGPLPRCSPHRSQEFLPCRLSMHFGNLCVFINQALRLWTPLSYALTHSPSCGHG